MIFEHLSNNTFKLVTETPDITLSNNKQVYAGDKPLKNLDVEDVIKNIVFIRNSQKGFWPVGWSLVYFMDNEQSAQDMKEGKIPYLMVPRGTRMSGGNPITDIWKKRFQKPGTEHILGVMEANTDDNDIFIDMLTVRSKYQRNKIGTLMLKMVKERFPKAKICTSQRTEQGEKFCDVNKI